MIRLTRIAGIAGALTLVLGAADAVAQSRARSAPPRHPAGASAPVRAGRPTQAVPRYPGRSVYVSPGRSHQSWHGVRGVAVPRSPYRAYGYRPYGYRPYGRPFYGSWYRSHYKAYWRPYWRPFYGYYPVGLGFAFGSPYYWAGFSYGYPSYAYPAYAYPAYAPSAYPPYAYSNPYPAYSAYGSPTYDIRLEQSVQPESNPGALAPGRIRVEVNPPDAEVFVDGYYVGVASDFDGSQQVLTVDAGARRVEFRARGYETLALQVLMTPGQTITLRRELRPLQP